MNQHDTVREIGKEIPFTIDGEPFTTQDRHQPAADLLRRAQMDPSLYDLGELHGQRPQTRRYADDEVVTIHKDARFVSIRHQADVA